MATARITREVPLPRKLWIGTYEYTVALVPHGDAGLAEDYGATYSDDQRKAIFIDSSLDTRKRLEIVLHELTHAIVWTHDLADVDSEEVTVNEETLCDRFGIAWSAFLLDNPRFQRWLTYTLNRIRKERKDGA